MKKKNSLLEDISLLIILLINFLKEKKNTRHYSICYKNYCLKWITEDFGYVKVHKIALLLVPDILSYNFFLGWHVFKANVTTLLALKLKLLKKLNQCQPIPRHSQNSQN